MAQDRATAAIRDHHRAAFVRNVAGFTSADVLTSLQAMPMKHVEDFVRISIEACFANRKYIKETVMPLVQVNAALNAYLTANFTINNDINYSALVTCGFCFLASGFEGTIGAQLAISRRLGSLDVYSWDMTKLSDKKKKATLDFTQSNERNTFAATVQAIKNLWTHIMVSPADGTFKEINLTNIQAEQTVRAFVNNVDLAALVARQGGIRAND